MRQEVHKDRREVKTMATLERITFETSRELEFFTEKELQMQIGHDRDYWPIAILRELVDNALDACEMAGVSPVIDVGIEADAFTVQDNGPGLPANTIAGSLNYLNRVSDKSFYVSPTRGQMGNALKVIYAAPFVTSGESGRVEIWTGGNHHTVEMSLDRIAQKPVIEHEVEEGFVKNGTIVKVHWPDSTGYLHDGVGGDYYRGNELLTAQDLMEGYAAFNPHATFMLGDLHFTPTDTEWRKWRPQDPTSAHWYTPETFRDLIAAYVSAEDGNCPARTVRAFVSDFRGLAGTAKQKEVTDGFSGVCLRDLVTDGDLPMSTITELLERMQATSRVVKSKALGIIGQDHIREWMVQYAGISEESIHYVKRQGTDTLPYVIEVAFGVREDDNAGRRFATGLNWSPTIGLPAREIRDVFAEMRVDVEDPVTVVVHMAKPRFEFLDRGKTQVRLA